MCFGNKQAKYLAKFSLCRKFYMNFRRLLINLNYKSALWVTMRTILYTEAVNYRELKFLVGPNK
jgi:hypothetical protein